MTFLPIVERELRAAARRKGTFRGRWWTAAVAITVTLFSVAILNIATVRAQGGTLFTTLTGFAFGLTFLAGVLLTADALAEEKRVGTLGLLFLTDLKGYDVVLGKLAATSLNAAYALLGLVPVIGLALLLGGVTGTELVRVALALVNSLFVSLAAGLAVSAFMRNAQRAMSNTLGLLFLLVFVVPFLAGVIQWEFRRDLVAQLAALSPLHAFQAARGSAGPGKFAAYLLASNLVGWCFLLAASWRLPRFALEEGAAAQIPRKRLALPAQPREGVRARRRQQLLSRSPVLWLLSAEPATEMFTWLVLGAWLLVVFAFGWFAGAESSVLTFYAASVCAFVFKMLIAIHACRFFAQARANGALEMLATTPLTNREVLKGQWLHLKRLFFWPLVVFWASTFVPLVMAVVRDSPIRDPGVSPSPMHSFWAVSGLSLWFTANLVAGVVAVGLVGMWLGLRMRKAALAPALTILLVLVLPMFLCGLGIVVELVLAIWAYNSLKADFRYASPGS